MGSLGGNGSLLWSVVLFIYYLLRILKLLTQEGAFTSAFGLATIFLVPTSPRSIRFLTQEEREVYCQDLADNWSGDADTDNKYDEVFSWSEVASVFTDAPHVLLMAIPSFLNGVTVTAPRSLMHMLMNYRLAALRPCLFVPASFPFGEYGLTYLQ